MERETRKRTWRFRPRVLAYGPLLTQLVITRRCNLSCGYCNEFDQVSDPVPKEVLKQRVDKIASLGALFLEYTGGETLLYPAFSSSWNTDRPTGSTSDGSSPMAIC